MNHAYKKWCLPMAFVPGGCLLAGLLAGLSVVAQPLQGTIVYKRTIDVWRHLPDEQMRAMVPQFQSGEFQLAYRDSIAVYKGVPKDDAPDPFAAPGGGGMVIKLGGPGDDGILYKNLSGRRLLEQTSLDDKKYVIRDSVRSPAWKLSPDTSTVLGHFCKKATAVMRGGKKVLAWYSEDIPLAAGPERFDGLPGVILRLDVDSGAMVFVATTITASVAGADLRAPAENKAISRMEYEKKLDEIMGPADSLGRRMIRR
jgi:GLPGLI family protein